MTFSGMDVEQVDRLAGQLKIQADAVTAVVAIIDGAVAGLGGVWSGDDLNAFHAGWAQTHRPRATALSSQLGGWVTELRQQVAQQRAASSGDGRVAASGATAATPTRANWRSPTNMLAFAKAAENDPMGLHPGQLPTGWSQLSPSDLRDLGIDPNALHDLDNGLDASIFTDGHGHYVISYAGSAGSMNPLVGTDWRDNYRGVASPVVAYQPGQTEAAADLARQLTTHVGAGNVELTGHSLGGRDAAVASVASGAAAVTFNAAAVTDEDLLYAREVSGHHVGFLEYVVDKGSAGLPLREATKSADITNYTTEGDPITGVQEALHRAVGERTALGTQVVVTGTNQDPVSAHSLRNFDGHLED